jgi:hypothetical protein
MCTCGRCWNQVRWTDDVRIQMTMCLVHIHLAFRSHKWMTKDLSCIISVLEFKECVSECYEKFSCSRNYGDALKLNIQRVTPI